MTTENKSEQKARWAYGVLRVVVCAAGLAATACGAPTIDGTGEDPDTLAPVASETTEDLAGAAEPCDWPQAFGTPSHAGHACPEIHGMHVAQRIVQDPDADAIVAQDGFLQIHLPPVLVSGDWVIVPTITGFTDVFHRETEVYHVTAWRWSPSVTAVGAHLDFAWSVDTDWQPVDAVVSPLFITFGYVQQFGTAISDGSVFVPEAGGRMKRLSLATGALQQEVDPLRGTPLDGDPRVSTVNMPAVGLDGAVYYATTAWPTDPPDQVFVGETPRASYLTRVELSGAVTTVDWSPDNAISLGGTPVASPSVGVKTFGSLCQYRFGTGGTTGPTGPTSQPPVFKCGLQRPALNAPFAFTPQGNLLVYTYANNARTAGYLVEVDHSTLSPIRSADVQDNHLRYGCGSRVTDFDVFPSCRVLTAGGTTNLGADPFFNGTVVLDSPADIMDNAPVVSPDGMSWVIGSYDHGFSFEGPGGFDARGALVVFRSDGSFQANNPRFGWESTPSARSTSPRGLTFQWLQDENRYSDFDFRVSVNDENMNPVASGGLSDPGVVEDFVDAHVTFDVRGGHYGVSDDGRFYRFGAQGGIVESIPLLKLDGSPADDETESVHVARDRAGRAYVPAGGLIHVVEGSGLPVLVPPTQATLPRVRRPGARIARFRAPILASDPDPPTEESRGEASPRGPLSGRR